MATLGTCLWFDSEAEEAAHFYTSIFPGSRILTTTRYPEGEPSPSGKPAGSVMTVEFELDGRRYTGLNGGPHFTFSEAVSIVVRADDQAESDRYWEALRADGGEPGPCGWLKDRFGLSWQVYPAELETLMADPDPRRAQAASAVMMTQGRIDLGPIREAADAA